ncbi:MAG: protein-tyrosine-phosphatase [Pseudorhodobacter sp. PARRP1]|nr:MAG: protein-tyrosine-phosphatase [Pseudorhodobacter sp. PARRP1]
MPSPQLTRRATLAMAALVLPGLALPDTLWAQRTAGDWAKPVPLAGVPNLHRVTPLIYRSAQPDAEGFRNLAALGVKTVINLRRTVDDSPLAAGTGLKTVHIKITTRHIRDENGAKIVLALQTLRDAQTSGPVLVHCTHGADRTGMIIALWRMLYQGWSRNDALDELQNGGFGFHHVWINIPRYLREVDLTALRARVKAKRA